jgi:hypothetical protein
VIPWAERSPLMRLMCSVRSVTSVRRSRERRLADPLYGSSLQLRKKREQRRPVSTFERVLGYLVTAQHQRGHQPLRLAQLE